MKLQPYRRLVRSDGKISQKDLYDEFIDTKNEPTAHIGPGEIPICDGLVPRLVSQRQFDAITMRRRVRLCIEAARIEAGLPEDGFRSGRFKYLKRHLVAGKRARAPSGSFVKCEPCVPSISN